MRYSQISHISLAWAWSLRDLCDLCSPGNARAKYLEKDMLHHSPITTRLHIRLLLQQLVQCVPPAHGVHRRPPRQPQPHVTDRRVRVGRDGVERRRHAAHVGARGVRRRARPGGRIWLQLAKERGHIAAAAATGGGAREHRSEARRDHGDELGGDVSQGTRHRGRGRRRRWRRRRRRRRLAPENIARDPHPARPARAQPAHTAAMPRARRRVLAQPLRAGGLRACLACPAVLAEARALCAEAARRPPAREPVDLWRAAAWARVELAAKAAPMRLAHARAALAPAAALTAAVGPVCGRPRARVLGTVDPPPSDVARAATMQAMAVTVAAAARVLRTRGALPARKALAREPGRRALVRGREGAHAPHGLRCGARALAAAATAHVLLALGAAPPRLTRTAEAGVGLAARVAVFHAHAVLAAEADAKVVSAAIAAPARLAGAHAPGGLGRKGRQGRQGRRGKRRRRGKRHRWLRDVRRR